MPLQNYWLSGRTHLTIDAKLRLRTTAQGHCVYSDATLKMETLDGANLKGNDSASKSQDYLGRQKREWADRRLVNLQLGTCLCSKSRQSILLTLRLHYKRAYTCTPFAPMLHLDVVH